MSSTLYFLSGMCLFKSILTENYERFTIFKTSDLFHSQTTIIDGFRISWCSPTLPTVDAPTPSTES